MARDKFVFNNSARIKPIRRRTAFCDEDDDAMCSLTVDPTLLCVHDDHLSKHSNDLVVEKIMEELMKTLLSMPKDTARQPHFFLRNLSII